MERQAKNEKDQAVIVWTTVSKDGNLIKVLYTREQNLLVCSLEKSDLSGGADLARINIDDEAEMLAFLK